MTTQRQVSVIGEVPDVNAAMAFALNVIEQEQLINPSIGIMPNPQAHCPCPDHFDDDEGFQVQVTGVHWSKAEEDAPYSYTSPCRNPNH